MVDRNGKDLRRMGTSERGISDRHRRRDRPDCVSVTTSSRPASTCRSSAAAHESASRGGGRCDRSLRLFTAAEFSRVAGSPFPGDRTRVPEQGRSGRLPKDYARRMRMPVRLGMRSRRTASSTGTRYVIEAGNQRLRRSRRRVTTGRTQKGAECRPWARVSTRRSSRSIQAHKNPAQLPPVTLVVGAGKHRRRIGASMAARSRTTACS
jgi:hypothetical protein